MLAFEPSYTGGVNVAAGDINGDGVPETRRGRQHRRAAGADLQRRAPARVLFDFVALSAAGVNGVQVAAGDVNADGLADLIVGAGPGGEPRVRVYDAANRRGAARLPGLRGRLPRRRVRGRGRPQRRRPRGHRDRRRRGGAPHVRAFNGVTRRRHPRLLRLRPAFAGGVRVASADLNADGHAEIVTGAGPGGAPQVKVFHGATNAEISSFLAYPADCDERRLRRRPVAADHGGSRFGDRPHDDGHSLGGTPSPDGPTRNTGIPRRYAGAGFPFGDHANRRETSSHDIHDHAVHSAGSGRSD